MEKLSTPTLMKWTPLGYMFKNLKFINLLFLWWTIFSWQIKPIVFVILKYVAY